MIAAVGSINMKKLTSIASIVVVLAQPFVTMANGTGTSTSLPSSSSGQWSSMAFNDLSGMQFAGNSSASDEAIFSGRDAARDFWGSPDGNLSYPETNDGTRLEIPSGTRDDGSTFGGGTAEIKDLFQAGHQDTSAAGAYNYSENDFTNMGFDARKSLESEGSYEGNAYRTLRESAFQSRPSLTNDPIFASTDAVYEILDGNGDAIQCDEPLNHEPVYKTCTRARKGIENRQSCVIEHVVEAASEHFTVSTAAMAWDNHTISFDLKNGSWWHSGDSNLLEKPHMAKANVPIINIDSVCSPGADFDITLSQSAVWNGGAYGSGFVILSDSLPKWQNYADCLELDRVVDHGTSGTPANQRYWHYFNRKNTPECSIYASDPAYKDLPSGSAGNTRVIAYDSSAIWDLDSMASRDDPRGITPRTGDALKKYSNIYPNWPSLNPVLTSLGYPIFSNASETRGVDETVHLNVLQYPTCDNGLVGKVEILDQTLGDDSMYIESLAGSFAFRINSIVKDEWDTDQCLPFAQNQRLEPTVQCTSYFGAGPNDCGDAGSGVACPNDLAPSPVPGISNMCRRVEVQYGNKPYLDGIENTCQAMESNPSCSFVTSTCADGTPEELVTRLYTYGLAKDPDSQFQYWVNRIKSGESYDTVKREFFDSANIENGELVNEFSCVAFTETYDCGLPEGGSNYGACSMKDLFEGDFADCEENLIVHENIETIRLEETETCDKIIGLTECTVERSFETLERFDSVALNRACIIEEEITVDIPWGLDNTAAVAITTTNYGSNSSVDVLEVPTIENGWLTRLKLNGSGEWTDIVEYHERTCFPNEVAPCFDEVVVGEEITCSVESNIDLRIEFTGLDIYVASIDEFPAEPENGPTCLRGDDGITSTIWSCQQTAQFNTGTLTVSDAARAALIGDLYPGEAFTQGAAACEIAVADYTTRQFLEGEFCATEEDRANGTCDQIDGTNSTAQPGDSTCGALEAMASAGECRLVASNPLDDVIGATGIEYLMEYQFECVIDEKEVITTTTEREFVCNGIVRCLGDECSDPQEDKSEDFSKAVAYLNALEASSDDIACAGAGTPDLYGCTVFPGEAQTCKQAIGGWSDCCDKPGDISLADYIEMLKAIGRLDNAIMNLAKTNSVAGSYAVLRDPVVDSIDYVGSWFTTAADNISGGAMSAASGTIEATYAAIQQSIIDTSYEIVHTAFGDTVASYIFQVGAEGTIELAGAISGALSFVGTIYTLYKLADLFVNIVWSCTDDELQLNVDRVLKKAHFVGSYCNSDSLFGCVEKRKSYCVFSTPLSRIVNREARKQLNKPWGSNKSPDCSGILLADLALLDWDLIDLSEWTDILKITGNFPDTDMDLTELTGNDGYLGQRQDEDRLDTVDRNVDRLDGVDLENLRSKASDELWSQQ